MVKFVKKSMDYYSMNNVAKGSIIPFIFENYFRVMMIFFAILEQNKKRRLRK